MSSDKKVEIRKVFLCTLKAECLYFYPQLLELIAKSQLTSLSGIAQKNYMNILEKVVQKGKTKNKTTVNLELVVHKEQPQFEACLLRSMFGIPSPVDSCLKVQLNLL